MILRLRREQREALRIGELIEDLFERELRSLQAVKSRTLAKVFRMTDQIIKFRHAELRHDFAHFPSDKMEVILHMFRASHELPAKRRILSRNPGRTGVLLTLAHHQAPHCHERRRSEAEFISAEHGADHNVSAGLDLPVHLQPYTAAEIIHDERLLHFCEPDFPRAAGVLNGGRRRRAGAAVMSGNHNVVCLALGHAGGHRADAGLRNQLDTDAGMRIGVFEVENQLSQILDRIDVVVRRRRNQPDARQRMAEHADIFRHFLARELPAFTGLRTLSHFDLNKVAVSQVVRRDAETP